MLTQHAGATGIRVNVLKPGLKARTEGNRKQDWTAVYVRARDLAELLPMAGDNVAAVTEAVRKSALTARKVESTSFSRVCVAGARRLLDKARTEADAAAAKAAADNNAVWG